MSEFLIMGPKGSGKSTILKRLQTLSDDKRLTPFDTIPGTRPTEGIGSVNYKVRQGNFFVKELGGAMIKEWLTYAAPVAGVIYTFDGADFVQTSTNIVWLNELLNEHEVEQKPVMIVLWKCDVPGCVRFNVIDEIIGFDRVLNPSRINFLETSSVVGVGLSDIFRWMTDIAKGHNAAATD
jgi:energy-coupling factor transporter ATP-binding protein EcfA2